jgi:type IV pilus assembly protein PilN
MRLDINLASQPYEDAGRFWMRWGTALVIASILTLVLLAITITGWFNARRDHTEIARLRTEIANRDRTRMRAEEFLNRPENRNTRDQSQFLNELIERKSLSWTYVLEDLENVMPPRVHLVSIHPELDEDNQLVLKLIVAGDSRDRVLELARRMEDSRRFSQTYIEAEHSASPGNGEGVQFDIAGLYVPQLAAAQTPPPAPPSAKTPTAPNPNAPSAAAPKAPAPTSTKAPTPKRSTH